MDDPKPMWITDILESNKTIAALNRDTETKIAEMGKAGTLSLIDLRTVPREEWDKWLNFDVPPPPMAKAFLFERDPDGRGREPLTEKEVHDLEDETQWFYNVTAPYYIDVSPTLRATGRAWAYVPEVAPYLSGFTLAKE